MRRIAFLICILVFILPSCSSKKSSKTSISRNSTVSKQSTSKANIAVRTSYKYRGTKYKYGGTTKKGIDCSGLMCASYKEAGVNLPRVSREQAKVGKRVYIGELQKGDLVFFGSKPGSKKITHVGMITKVGKSQVLFIHASTSKGVVESDLKADYYRKRYILARRVN